MTTTAPPEVTDPQKQQVWDAFHALAPTRVPMMLSTNPRHVVLNPEWNPWGYSFRDCFDDVEAHVRIQLQHELYRRRVIHRYCDYPTELPEVWEIDQQVYNVYEAAALGAELEFPDEQVPSTAVMTEAQLEAMYEQDITDPLSQGWLKQRLDFWHEMDRFCADLTFEGRPVRLKPWALLGSDGPLTVGCNLRGTEMLMDLLAEPARAQRLMSFITDAAIHRRRAFCEYWGERIKRVFGGADDSCALIGVDTYRQFILPLHRRLYENDGKPGEGVRGIHLCGDATHLFPTIHEELGVMRFDTGFPVDHGKLRDQLGEDVLIQGGTSIDLLVGASTDTVYTTTRDILRSGVMRGGRFILREGHNLPPNARRDNLEAMYAACLEFGRYG